jgi:hypothetical protein
VIADKLELLTSTAARANGHLDCIGVGTRNERADSMQMRKMIMLRTISRIAVILSVGTTACDRGAGAPENTDRNLSNSQDTTATGTTGTATNGTTANGTTANGTDTTGTTGNSTGTTGNGTSGASATAGGTSGSGSQGRGGATGSGGSTSHGAGGGSIR